MPEKQLQAQLIEQTRREINRLVQEIEQLAAQNIDESEFYAQYLRRVLAVLAAQAAVIWLKTPQGNLQLRYQINLQQMGLHDNEATLTSHNELLRFLTTQTKPAVLPPNSGPGDELNTSGLQNPTKYLLVVAPIVLESQSLGLVEVFQDPERRGEAQDGYLRFLVRIAEEAAKFIKNRRFRQFLSQEQLWNQFDVFIRGLHACQTSKQVAYLLANDGRKLVGAERLSVAVQCGKIVTVEAISGQDVVEKRSNLVRRMCKLAEHVISHGENLLYTGTMDETWPRDTSDALQAYREESNCRLLIAVVMKDERELGKRGKPNGVLLVEMIEDQADPSDLAARVESVTRHGALALANAQDQDRILFLPMWRALGQGVEWVFGRGLSKVAVCFFLLALVTIGMIVIPWPLRLEGRGELVPEKRRTVYAPTSGTVESIKVGHADQVEEGSTLAVMSRFELDRELLELEGKLRSAKSIFDSLNAKTQRDRDNKIRDQMDEQRLNIVNLEQQIKLVEKQRKELEVVSPIRGRVMDWNPREKLARRPVQQGDPLLEIAAVEGRWVIEVQFPENTVSHIAAGRRETQSGELPVTFVLSAAPDYTYHGTLVEFATKANPVEQKNVVEAKIIIDAEEEPRILEKLTSLGKSRQLDEAVMDIRTIPVAGVEVRAKVNCGPRALGYVLFRELIDFVREYVFF